MLLSKNIEKIISLSIVYSLISLVFLGLLAFDSMVDDGRVEAKSIIVDKGGNGNYTIIQDAIDNATPVDTIYVWAGTYYENVIVNKTVTLIGNGTGKTIINGSDAGNVVHVTADNVEIRGFTIIESGSAYSSGTYDAGIELDHVKNARISDNNCSDNAYGIYLNYSNSNVVMKNLCLDNGCGIYLRWSDSNTISNNICNKNRVGIDLFWSDYNKISNNTLNSNSQVGCYLDYSDRNTLYNNTCTLNGFSGTTMWNSNWNHINKNIISNNGQGLWFYNSENNTFENNTCNSNFQLGMFSDQCDSNTFISNNFSLNSEGVVLYLSNINIFENNNISSNDIGVNFTWGMNNNVFFKNNISFNTRIGIIINFNCNNNQFYHNNIISNTQQLAVIGSQDWHHYNEGNYWSDYAGSDDGTGDRTAGDGIGDTNIPHLGVDYYPFVKPSGWLYPGTPLLKTESAVDSDGNYSISWWNNPKATGYVLEEDTTETFDSPTEHNQGWEIELDRLVFQAENKPENTYYYRLKANNDLAASGWSKVVNITIDYIPIIPQNFQASVYPGGNALNLSWDFNLKDTTGYEVYYKENGDLTWELLENVTHPTHTFNHTGLVDGVRYYYRTRSCDGRGQRSDHSEVIEAVPKDTLAPAAPTGLNATALSDHEIELTWMANTDSDTVGYAIYMDSIIKPRNDGFHIIHTAANQDTSYTISGLTEQVTYFFKMLAFDEVPNNSLFSEVVAATPPDVTKPKAPTELVVTNATNDSLTLSWTASIDKDVIGYILYEFENENDLNLFSIVNKVPITENVYIHHLLMENTIHYYRLKAIDDADLKSSFSDLVIGITLMKPAPPIINNSITDFDLKEDFTDELSINLYYWFKDPNNDQLAFRVEGQDNIQVTIYQDNGTVILTPEKNWNGVETLYFYAKNSVSEVSDEVTITVTPVNDPPERPKILKPGNNIEVNQGEKLDFSGECYDPDMVYGDVLVFKWFSSIDDLIGIGANLTDNNLSAGKHVITLEVSDKERAKASVTIDVTVKKATGSDTSGPAQSANTAIAIAGIIIIIIVIVLVLIFLMFRKKRSAQLSLKSEVNLPMPSPVQPTLGQPPYPQPPGRPQYPGQTAFTPGTYYPSVGTQTIPQLSTQPPAQGMQPMLQPASKVQGQTPVQDTSQY